MNRIRTFLVLAGIAVVVALGACRRVPAPVRPPAPASNTPAPPERTVFTDSVLHAEQCAPVQPGQDWRQVCTPIDQRNRRSKPVTPPPAHR
ncbi:MAG TPA: hypothetical protein VGD77_00280 [Gemmatimonadaceae bacterium]